MAKARRRDLWDQTAALRADLRNMFSQSRTVHPDELNPLREHRRPPRDGKAIVKNLVAAFVGL